MGVVTPVPLRTYPDGFPEDILDQLHDASGRGILCNQPYSGTAVIDDFGERHLATGDLIVYTSADSVLQIAAHVDEVPPAELYAICAAAREIMSGEHAVGRVIARPFRGEPGRVRAHRRAARTSRCRRPRGRTWTSCRRPASRCTRSGKIGQVFDGVGVDVSHKGATNEAALAATAELIDGLDGGFVFTNLVETDQIYGHRGDVPGWHEAMQGDRRRGRPLARAAGPGARHAGHHRRPRLRPDDARAPTTRASTCRCSRASRATAAGATMVRLRTSAHRCCSG